MSVCVGVCEQTGAGLQQLRRQLHLHEAYSLELMRKANINVPNCVVARSPEAAEVIARNLGECVSVCLCVCVCVYVCVCRVCVCVSSASSSSQVASA
jgi:hypothetical protein